MIKSAEQLKALIRNKAGRDSSKAQLLLRVYAVERFLERLSLSGYRNSFIIKGGVLVAAIVGSDSRATQDLDTTICNFNLDLDTCSKVIEEICSIELEDKVSFSLKGAEPIMDEAEYGGIRIAMNAHIEGTRIPVKIDISTGDAITPKAIDFSYALMFEKRSIKVLAYNIETLLAEKVETILSRSVLNTRTRDFYDVYVLQLASADIQYGILKMALQATSAYRNSQERIAPYHDILQEIARSSDMKQRWESYRNKNSYVGDLEWDTVLQAVIKLCAKIL